MIMTLCILLITTLALQQCTGADLVILPDEINAVVNEDLHVTCMLSTSFATMSLYTSQNLSFRFRLNTGEEQMPQECEDIYRNDTTVKLYCKFLPAKFHNGYVVCYVRDSVNPVIYVERQLHVGERPGKTNITLCEVRNWDTLRFQWNDSGHVYQLHYEAGYKNSMQSEFTRCSLAAHNNECVVNNIFSKVAPDNVLMIRIIMANMLGNHSTIRIYQLMHIVKPDEVEDLRVMSVDKELSIYLVTFQSPKPNRELVYMLFVECLPTHFNMSERIGPTTSTFVSERLVGLPAYSACTTWVKAKPLFYGFWGPEAKSVFFTSQQVPVGAPEVNRNGFELHNHPSGTRDIILHFKPMLHEIARGLVTEYRLQYVCRGQSVKQLFPVTQGQFWLNLSGLHFDVDYYLTLDARTDKGYNDSLHLNTVYIPKFVYVPHVNNSLSAVVLTDTTVRCSWPISEGLSYTLFWCPATVQNQGCSDVVSWQPMPLNASEYIITVSESLPSVDYIFGISAEDGYGHGSGIMWTDCVSKLDEGSALPPVVSLLSMNGCCSSTILLRRPSCSDDNRGQIVAYMMYCCLVAETAQCTDSNIVQVKKVSAHSSEVTATIVDLWPMQRYVLLVESLTAAGTTSSRNATLVMVTASGNRPYVPVISSVLGCAIGLLLVVMAGVSASTFRRYCKRLDSRHLIKQVKVPSQNTGIVDIEPEVPSMSCDLQLVSDLSYSCPSGNCKETTVVNDDTKRSQPTFKSTLDTESSCSPLLSIDISHNPKEDHLRILPPLVDEAIAPLSQPSVHYSTSLFTRNMLDDDVLHPLTLKRFLPRSSLSGSSELHPNAFDVHGMLNTNTVQVHLPKCNLFHQADEHKIL